MVVVVVVLGGGGMNTDASVGMSYCAQLHTRGIAKSFSLDMVPPGHPLLGAVELEKEVCMGFLLGEHKHTSVGILMTVKGGGGGGRKGGHTSGWR